MKEDYTRSCEAAPRSEQTTVSVANVWSGLWTPFASTGLLSAAGFPQDRMDRFNSAGWVRNLSHYYQSQNNTYAKLIPHAATTLADSVYIGAKHCSGHNDTASHAYQGYSGCCQYYVRSVRRELIAIGQCSSRHSRSHTNYKDAVVAWDTQMRTLYANYAAWLGSRGLVVQPYPAMPVDGYQPLNFDDWLVQMSSQNPRGTYTDGDDSGMLSETVFVQNRFAGCGHDGPSYHYTNHNWCGHQHHSRSMKVDLFQTAINLANNQTAHDNYVRVASAHESAVKGVLGSCWQALANWGGFAVPSGLVVSGQPGVVVSSTGGVLTGAQGVVSQDLHARLVSNRGRAVVALENLSARVGTLSIRCKEVVASMKEAEFNEVAHGLYREADRALQDLTKHHQVSQLLEAENHRLEQTLEGMTRSVVERDQFEAQIAKMKMEEDHRREIEEAKKKATVRRLQDGLMPTFQLLGCSREEIMAVRSFDTEEALANRLYDIVQLMSSQPRPAQGQPPSRPDSAVPGSQETDQLRAQVGAFKRQNERMVRKWERILTLAGGSVSREDLMRSLDDSDRLFELMDERMDAVASDMARRADAARVVASAPPQVGAPQSAVGVVASPNPPATGGKLL